MSCPSQRVALTFHSLPEAALGYTRIGQLSVSAVGGLNAAKLLLRNAAAWLGADAVIDVRLLANPEGTGMGLSGLAVCWPKAGREAS